MTVTEPDTLLTDLPIDTLRTILRETSDCRTFLACEKTCTVLRAAVADDDLWSVVHDGTEYSGASSIRENVLWHRALTWIRHEQRGYQSCMTVLPLELGEDGWKAWVMSIHQNLSIEPLPIRLNDASLGALAETVEGSLVELMEKSVLCAVHRLHGVSHDGNDDVPNPFLPTVGG